MMENPFLVVVTMNSFFFLLALHLQCSPSYLLFLRVVVSKIIQYKISDDITFSLNIFTIFLPFFFLWLVDIDNINHKEQMEPGSNGGGVDDGDNSDTFPRSDAAVVVVGLLKFSV